MKSKNLLIDKNSSEVFEGLSEISGLGAPFKKPVIMAGPCSLENEEMIDSIAKKLSDFGVRFLRAGIFKPRTSPYDFQGIGPSGMKILKKVSEKYNMRTVSEVTDVRYIEKMVDFIDVLQVGARNMHNFELLKELGKTRHPILLKRGMCATIDELKLSAEYIALGGNRSIILCERGIRTFESSTRNTLDISAVPILQKETKLPVIVDLSHSLGRKDIVNSLGKAVAALGADGIMIEVHCSPENALSDRDRQLNFGEFEEFMKII